MQNQSALAPIESKVADLFALSDEQILEIAPEAEMAGRQDSVVPVEGSSLNAKGNLGATAEPSATGHESPVTGPPSTEQGKGAQPGLAVPLEPPAWLAAQMKDPCGGEEAREFWDGVQQARTEAAAYRAAFATPEDARALKELYPGGVSEARAAAERGRLLEEIDRAYFGAAGNPPEQTSAARAQLAQRMLREDPAAFREMIFAGLHALQEAEQGSGAANEANLPRLARVIAESRSTVGAQLHPEGSRGNTAPPPGNTSADNAHVAAYVAFERAANEDLERSVGGAIERTLAQALPAGERKYTSGQARPGEQAGAQPAAPLQQRLAQAIRQDVEKGLQGDRQLGEQVAQILSSRRFDNDTRAHIVRLISDRAQQLVPGAAKRVLNEWTQTTLAAHRGRTQRADSASATVVAAARPEVYERAPVPARPVGSGKTSTHQQNAPRSSGQASAIKSQAINYRKLSDEQILEM